MHFEGFLPIHKYEPHHIMIKIPIKILAKLRIVRLNQIYKFWEIEQLRRVLNELNIDCVFDVGANIGQYAQMLRKEIGFKGRIISFEPNPELAGVLQEQAKMDSKWEVHNVALSNSIGKLAFNIMSDSQFSSFNRPRKTSIGSLDALNQVTKTVEVETKTLDSLYEELKALHGFSRPFLKMDTQGHDSDVFRGAAASINEFIGLQSELAIQQIYESGDNLQKSLELYQSSGFVLSSFIPNNQGWFPCMMEVDCLMVRREVADSYLK